MWACVIYFMILYICYLQLGCHPVAVVQYTFTHRQYTEQPQSTQTIYRKTQFNIEQHNSKYNKTIKYRTTQFKIEQHNST
jgi:hypothetical protein